MTATGDMSASRRRSLTIGWVLLAASTFNLFMAGFYAGQGRADRFVCYAVVAAVGSSNAWGRLRRQLFRS